MVEKNDGGPAFPVHDVLRDEKDKPWFQADHYGMSLRDWFAGQALAGFLANKDRPTTMAPDDAEYCYSIADAMLAARGGSHA